MKFKKVDIYPIYLSYTERKKLSKGAFKLAEISESLFIDFKNRYIKLPGFKYKQDNLYKSAIRDINIDKILDSDYFNISPDNI